mgnify:CR=1 FL=1
MTKLWRGYKTSFWRIFFSSVMITLTKVCLSQLRFLHVFLALGHYARDMFASKTDQKRKQQKGESTCPRYTLRRNQLWSGKYIIKKKIQFQKLKCFNFDKWQKNIKFWRENSNSCFSFDKGQKYRILARKFNYLLQYWQMTKIYNVCTQFRRENSNILFQFYLLEFWQMTKIWNFYSQFWRENSNSCFAKNSLNFRAKIEFLPFSKF